MLLVLRLISGIAGVALLIAAFGLPDLFETVWENLPASMAGFGTATALAFGVYLVFYAITGDWMPSLRKRKAKTVSNLPR